MLAPVIQQLGLSVWETKILLPATAHCYLLQAAIHCCVPLAKPLNPAGQPTNPDFSPESPEPLKTSQSQEH